MNVTVAQSVNFSLVLPLQTAVCASWEIWIVLLYMCIGLSSDYWLCYVNDVGALVYK